MNFRMGALGYLSLNTPEFSGNMGMKDQQLAIQWAYDNIHNFGGDRKQTTLYGSSSGRYKHFCNHFINYFVY